MDGSHSLTIPQWFLILASLVGPLVMAVLIPYLRGVARRQEIGNNRLSSIDKHLAELGVELRNQRGRIRGLSKGQRRLQADLSTTREELAAIRERVETKSPRA